MKNVLNLIIFLCCSGLIQAQITDISGTWYLENDNTQVFTINQNQQYLTFVMSNGSSNGYFTSANQLYATDWNAYATLSADGNRITWSNQVWVRLNAGSSVSYPNISGKFYVNGDASQAVEIKQNGQYLTFIMSNSRSEGYFTTANQVYASEWDAYGTVASDGSITWSNQTWSKNASGVNTTTTTTGRGKQCRLELSMFYAGSQALGSIWGRVATSPSPLPGEVVNDCRSALTSLRAGLDNMPCVVFDRTKIQNLDNRLPTLSASQAVDMTEELIKNLQVAVAQANPSCDGGLNISNLYVAGVHLGAAQAWASSRMCQPAPMPLNIQQAIRAHLTTATNALRPSLTCLPYFDINILTGVPLNSRLSTQPHTFIVGIQTQVLWNLGMSECCCNCPHSGSSHQTQSDDPCDKDCQEYCKRYGKRNGKYNGKSVCLMGIVEQPASGCDCWD
jgi:hypothetical protein